MDFLPIFIKMEELFAIIIIGYIANKCNIFGPKAKAHLSKLIINITMPCTILASVMNSTNLPSRGQIVKLLIVSFSTYIVLFIIAKLTSFLLRVKGPQKGAVEFGIMFANVGFIGFPVTEAIFGSDALFYTSVFNMPFNLLCYSLGIAMVSGYGRVLEDGTVEDNGKAGFFAGAENTKDKVKKILKLVCSPAMLAAIACIIMGVTKWQGHRAVADVFDMVGGITTPGALLIIGSALADMPFKEMFTNVRAYIFTIIKVIMVPLIMLLIYKNVCGSDTLLFGDTVIISAMPVATAGTMLSVAYGGDEKFMAQITFISTLATVVTIPFLAMFLG